jgi:hypothetical protein
MLHQDGAGTVDSGHYCHAGYNDVIVMSRGTESQMQHAMDVLFGNVKCDACDRYKPHDDGQKPDWPTTKAVNDCRAKTG